MWLFVFEEGQLVFSLLPPPFCLSPQPKANSQKKKKSFLSLMANSHKFVLNMSSIDWSCQMKTIKEMALSAAHLGGEDEGIKRGGMVEAKQG